KPQFHFLPKSNWMNDPNAPFYDEETGLYHLMYQYLTPRVWGHAISTNMADWKILGTALNYTEEWYTQVPGAMPGVYSGSATIMRGTVEQRSQVWLSASTPTNDMMLLAYPASLADPTLENWTWDSLNPVIYATSNETNGIPPPGRDPTEFWPCGQEGDNQWCVAYATQLSEGCPCSGVSGMAIFSAVFYDSAPMSPLSWGSWNFEGYMLNDTAGAVMWECVDFFPLNDDDEDPFAESVWMLKYSIGPGPSLVHDNYRFLFLYLIDLCDRYTLPWGNPGPRDYYVTGVYDPKGKVAFDVDDSLWDEAMQRDTSVALDNGAFYASKTFLSDAYGRVLWGWLPEERPSDGYGEPFGWAGAMSLPRQVIPYRNGSYGSWMVRTPPVEAVLENIRTDSVVQSGIVLRGTEYVSLVGISGQQVEVLLHIDTTAMNVGDQCGVRVLSSLDISPESAEYTDIGLTYFVETEGSSLTLSVDPSNSCSDASAKVNRTISSTAPLHNDFITDAGNVDLRVIIDHSVVESFLAGGRRATTRRVYPS
ncbi:unnamed protein product, partial [Ectocarpus fasciculatus]